MTAGPNAEDGLVTRRATERDLPAVVETLVLAFDQDPAWSTVLDDASMRPTQFTYLFTLFVQGALPHGGVWMTEGAEAVSVWLPPGADEMTPEQNAAFEEYVERLPGPNADAVGRLVELFEEYHPVEEPHHYLSLLGTHPDHRGKGIGMALVRSDLARIDAAGEPAYLESTNPGNLGRYASVGFVEIGEFAVPNGSTTVTTMWRDAR